MIFCVGKFVSLPESFEFLVEDATYMALVEGIVEIYNSKAGSLKIAAGYSLAEFFQKPIDCIPKVMHVLREISKMISLSALILNCKCFDRDISQVSNQLLLALCSTSIGIDMIVQHESLEKYLTEPGYNPDKREVLLHLTQNPQISPLLSPQLSSSLQEALKSKALPSTSEVESTSK